MGGGGRLPLSSSSSLSPPRFAGEASFTILFDTFFDVFLMFFLREDFQRGFLEKIIREDP